MRRVRLPGTDLDMSRGVYGTARIHRLPSRSEQERLLTTAVEAGFTHFDTASAYGFGQAEAALGCLAGAGVTIATKVGLYPPGGENGSSQLNTLARKIAGKLAPSLSRLQVSADVARAERSLSRSLQRLGRDRVDILFIHEPDPKLFMTAEWTRWQQREQERGRVRHFGLAGEPAHVLGWTDSNSDWTALLQTRDTDGAAKPLRIRGLAPQLTYGLLGSDDELAAGLARNPNGAVVVSSRDPAALAARLVRLDA